MNVYYSDLYIKYYLFIKVKRIIIVYNIIIQCV
jgi:hypothetical protein